MIERKFLQEGIKKISLEEHLRKELRNSGFTSAEMMKTPLVTRIVLNATRPGLIIGKRGQNIKKLTKEIEEKFKIDNPQIEIKQIAKPELDAKAMVEKICTLINKGFAWRNITYKVVKEIMDAGAQGVELRLSGKLGGKGARKMRKRIAEGYMKKIGDEAKLVDYAKGPAVTKAGTIGVKLRIVRPGIIFPDKIGKEQLIKEETKEEKKAEEKPIEEKPKEIPAKEDKGIEIEEKEEKETKKEKTEEAKEAKKENREEKDAKEIKKEKIEEKPEKKETKGDADENK